VTARAWELERGATALDGDTTRFSVWAPAAKRVDVVLLAGGERRVEPLAVDSNELWSGEVEGCGPGTDYFYLLDGKRERPDPVSRLQAQGVHGPSRVVDPADFGWTDAGWGGAATSDLTLYELHVGAFTQEGTFEAVAEKLDYLATLGITAIELMPVATFPGQRNWGYDGVHPYAPHAAYGGPRGLRRLVDAAHQRGLAVFLDVVYNHLGPEGNYLAEYGPYFTDRYGTPWGLAINFDGPGSDQVRRYFIDNALYWITEYHIDGLRLDAVQTIFDFSARHFLAELAESTHRQGEALGRSVLMIAESDLNDPRLVRPRKAGGYDLNGMWNDDFHHAVHAALTGERDGYYVDYGSRAHIIKTFRERFVLDGRYSEFRRRRHGAPAADVPADRFVVFIQNHDQVGNRARGERLAALVSFAERKLAAALLLLSPYVPLLFMGEEYGETAPFQYFVDHGDPQLIEAVRRGRRQEFERFDWEGDIPDPAAEETFARSRLQLGRSEKSPHAELLYLYRDLLQLRQESEALRPGRGTAHVEEGDSSRWLAVLYETETERLVSAFNLTGNEVEIDMRVPEGRWERLLATDDARYGGAGSPAPAEAEVQKEGMLHLNLAAHGAVVMAQEGR